jgi:hypothetical protein
MVNLFFYYIERLLYIACLLSVYIYAADARIETTYSFNTYGSVGLIILFLYTNLKTKYAFKVFFSLKKYYCCPVKPGFRDFSFRNPSKTGT